MMLKHLDLLGSRKFGRNVKNLEENLRAFSCFFLFLASADSEEERKERVECCGI